MIRNTLLFIVLISSTSFSSLCQITDKLVDVNDFLSLGLEALEIRIVGKKTWTDTSYYLHYSVSNISNDTLSFTTNSCPSYNLYQLTINDITYTVNEGVRCSSNSSTIQDLFPNQSISQAVNVHSDFRHLKAGIFHIILKLPVLINSDLGFSIDGLSYKNKIDLIFEGKVPIIIETEGRLKKKNRAQ